MCPGDHSDIEESTINSHQKNSTQLTSEKPPLYVDSNDPFISGMQGLERASIVTNASSPKDDLISARSSSFQPPKTRAVHRLLTRHQSLGRVSKLLINERISAQEDPDIETERRTLSYLKSINSLDFDSEGLMTEFDDTLLLKDLPLPKVPPIPSEQLSNPAMYYSHSSKLNPENNYYARNDISSSSKSPSTESSLSGSFNVKRKVSSEDDLIPFHYKRHKRSPNVQSQAVHFLYLNPAPGITRERSNSISSVSSVGSVPRMASLPAPFVNPRTYFNTGGHRIQSSLNIQGASGDFEKMNLTE